MPMASARVTELRSTEARANVRGLAVGMAAARRKGDGGVAGALAAVGLLVGTGADAASPPELGRDRRPQFEAAGRRVEAYRLGHRGELLRVGGDFLLARDVVAVGMR